MYIFSAPNDVDLAGTMPIDVRFDCFITVVAGTGRPANYSMTRCTAQSA